MTQALLVTADPLLHEQVQRLAAAAGVPVATAADVPAAHRAWAGAALVLVGADLAPRLAATGPVRRPGVHVLAIGRVPDDLFREALLLGAESVAELPASEGWLVETLTDAADLRDGSAGRATTVGVLGGCGGAGASVFAAALAATVASGREGRQVLLVDADPLGAGADRLLGMEGVAGIRWDAVCSTTGRISGRALRESLPRRDGVSVLSWSTDRGTGLQGFALREVLAAGRRGHDLTVLDLPRHPDPWIDEALSRCDHLVLVAGVSVVAVTAAARLATRLRDLPARPHLVVRGSGGLAAEEVAALLKIPLAAAMADQRGLDEAIDLGAGPLRSRRSALARAARVVADRVCVPDGRTDAGVAA